MDIVTMGALKGKINNTSVEMTHNVNEIKNSVDALKSAMSVVKIAESDGYVDRISVSDQHALEGVPLVDMTMAIIPKYMEEAEYPGFWTAGTGTNLLVPVDLSTLETEGVNGVHGAM